MEYSFDIEIAKKYGINEAIMIKNFQYWIRKNKSNNLNYNDGRTWTYNSVDAFTLLFPFWSYNQTKRILSSLIQQEVLVTGNYNKAKYDRTKWYAFVDEQTFVDSAQCNVTKAKKQSVKRNNAKDDIAQPIPNINTDSKHNSLYTNMIAIYDGFCLNEFDAPSNINGQEGKAMKQIIKYLKSVCKAKGDDSDSAIQNAFKYILNNWNQLEPFYQKQIKLSQINSNITNIINNLKNGKAKSNRSSIAREILAKYQ